MPPAPASAPSPEPPAPAELTAAYAAWLTATGRLSAPYLPSARTFLARWPRPQAWAAEPLEERLAANARTRPFLYFLMLHRRLRPGYDYLLERRLTALVRQTPASPLGPELERFVAAAIELGYARKSARGDFGPQVLLRMLIESGNTISELCEPDLLAFDTAIGELERRRGHPADHYRWALTATRAILYHLGAPVDAPTLRRANGGKWSWERRLEGVAPAIRRSLVAYLECCLATRVHATVEGIATCLAHFGRHLAAVDPDLGSLADLDRQRHIEPYLAAVARARNPRTGAPLAASERRSRILTLGRMLADITEWGWPQAPPRQLVFPRDAPRLPRPLPRYLPPDADRRLVAALEASPYRLRADALLLQRATGLRIGELLDLELDCVHEVPGAGAWLKVPLGKLQTERMVPLDEETLALLDRIVQERSPGRPLPHPKTGRLVEFLLTYHGRRISQDTLRGELHRASAAAGLPPVTPHQLRHTYATALINAGVSLQALMALLGHQSAEMSLRYGRLFDQTVRADYERALALAKQRLGPVLPEATPAALAGDWRQAPLIKARLAGGYCLRTPAQGACAYANICEHCPNFRSEATFLPILATQRTDAEALAADAEQRGWGEEAARHRALVERLDLLISRAQAG